MSGARITIDGLLRCLCPSIDAVALAAAHSVPYRPRRARSLVANPACAGPRAAAPRRRLHTTPRRPQDDGAEKKEESATVSDDTETLGGPDTVSKASDPGDKQPGLNVDQEATKAWRGYFDVILLDGVEERQDSSLPTFDQPVGGSPPVVANAEAQQKSMTADTVIDAETVGQPDVSPLPFHSVVQSPSTVAVVDAGQALVDELFGAEEEKPHGLLKPNDVDGGSSPISAAVEDDRVASSNEVSDTVAGNDPFDALIDAEKDQRHDSAASEPMKKETVEAPRVTQRVDQVPPARKRARWGSGSPLTDMTERLLRMKPPFTDVPPEAGKKDIFAALSLTKMQTPAKYRKITATLLKHLLSLDPRPMNFYYDMLLRAHCSPKGSANVILDLIQEMRRENLWSPPVYHSVLRALAIHPDYLLRNVIIKEMKERWVEILPKGHRYIAIGLLRDEQYELALEKLEQMIQQGIEVDPWVFDIFVYVFGKLGFLDDALRLVRHRLDRGFQVSVNIWYFLLDESSKGQFHEATTYIWNRTVQEGIVNPSDGVALNTLNMASVYGDTDLATQVIQYLSERGTRLSRPHYEALADAYSVQGNVERAIEVYCIMYSAGAEVNHASTGTLCQSLSRDPAHIDRAVDAMAEFKKKYKLPVSVFNAVLDEMAKCSAFPPEEAFLKALDLYRRVREFLPAGPNRETFRNLLRQCTSPDIAQFLASEMVGFNIRQNLVIVELIFKVNVENNGPKHRVKASFYRVAPHLHSSYAPGSRRWQNIMDLSLKLVKRLIAERDPEGWRILDICKQNGLGDDKVKALREEVEAGRVATT